MRIILIDNASGYIWGDSADYKGRIYSEDDIFTDNPNHPLRVDAAAFSIAYAGALDRNIGEAGRSYKWSTTRPANNETGYHAYRADVNGSDAVAIVHDGQDQETIEAVMEHCQHLGFIAVTQAAHG